MLLLYTIDNVLAKRLRIILLILTSILIHCLCITILHSLILNIYFHYIDTRSTLPLHVQTFNIIKRIHF